MSEWTAPDPDAKYVVLADPASPVRPTDAELECWALLADLRARPARTGPPGHHDEDLIALGHAMRVIDRWVVRPPWWRRIWNAVTRWFR